MAPLLGRKPFPLAKPLSEAPPGEGEEEVYIIEHSKEAFRSRDDFSEEFFVLIALLEPAGILELAKRKERSKSKTQLDFSKEKN